MRVGSFGSKEASTRRSPVCVEILMYGWPNKLWLIRWEVLREYARGDAVLVLRNGPVRAWWTSSLIGSAWRKSKSILAPFSAV